MIDFSLVDAVNDHFPVIAVALDNSDCFFINSVGHEIFSERTVIAILNFRLSVSSVLLHLLAALVVQVFDINKVNVATFHCRPIFRPNYPVHALLSEERGAHFQVVLIVFFLKGVVYFFDPRMIQNLRDRYSLLWG